uniref:DIOX_N domain-containing protein n=1 Tax=Ascaris lumbricoides TaxID=6252 RepID=A0A0M3I5B2_ASCLU
MRESRFSCFPRLSIILPSFADRSFHTRNSALKALHIFELYDPIEHGTRLRPHPDVSLMVSVQKWDLQADSTPYKEPRLDRASSTSGAKRPCLPPYATAPRIHFFAQPRTAVSPFGGPDTKITELMGTYPVFEPIERNKLRCTLTGHELPARGNQLDEYTKSKKFVRAWRIHKIMEEYSDCFDDVGENKFGCKLTMKLVAKDPDDLERHIAGKKFKRALEKGFFFCFLMKSYFMILFLQSITAV